ncbi:MAG TPA: hypothetical protein VMT34_09520 [Aggregatilineales bacterium]|nr:hypothetical protein [Aggregatilineales bacterium]
MDSGYVPRLGEVFQFNEADLAVNREGRLSPAQIAALRRQALLRGLILVVALLGIGVLAYASADPGSGDVYVFFFFIIVPGALALALTAGVTEITIAASRPLDKRSGQAHLRTAPHAYEPPLDPAIWVDVPMPGTRPPRLPARPDTATIPLRIARGQGLHTLIVGDREFKLTAAQYGALSYSTYTVYFLPRLGNRIVAVEPFAAEPTLIRTLSPGTATPYTDEGEGLRG